MPELPDITAYIEALEQRVVGHVLDDVRLPSPFLLRTTEPPITTALGKRTIELRRIGKRIAFGLEDDLWLVLHLMIAGRLHWHERDKKIPGKRGLAAFDFDNGTLILTEAGTTKRASLHVIHGRQHVLEIDRGGIQPLTCSLEEFGTALSGENHTLKRSLTDPRLFSGIGNAYSDEILHSAHLSPVKLTHSLTEGEIKKLYHATRDTLNDWIERLRVERGDSFPNKVTAFRDGMAVHGRYSEPCPECGTKVQRIRYKSNETNYCPRCQTGGKLLADRSLSRLLKKDWPRTIDELE